ncbi:DDE transposase [Sphingobacteruim zhuxiongii]|uniref:DDE transposase n=2 Tax=Sphingobacterium zhuxiongii TaxID=2662364 RepID=A0A5Q0QHB5_9SPHI|nr:DDE transposase [Sphingobacterium sp. dk4302]
MSSFYGISASKLRRYYRNKLSGFQDWEHRENARDGLIFPQNISGHLSIDETCLSHGELYTVVTNKEAHGKKGTIVAILSGTKSENIIPILQKIQHRLRNKVQEITLDLAGNMGLIAKRCFSNAVQVIDRFHVQQLATEALQEIRIKHRWQAIEEENQAIEAARKVKETYLPKLLPNGDTVKQMLARSRYLLYKSEHKWTLEQRERAGVLFERYPDVGKAYRLAQELSWIFNTTIDKIYAFTRLAKWADKVEQAGFRSFNTVSRTINIHHKKILNYFDNRSTNASAESFNAKIKAFRSQFRGVGDINFFLFRLTKLFA